MTPMARELRSWLALAAIVIALAAGLAIRAGTPGSDAAAEATASASPTASPPPTAEPMARVVLPLTETISPPTRATAPSPTDAPADPSATPAPVAAAPSAPAITPPPAAPTPTPVPVHNPEPSLLTQERVDGGFGQTLSIDTYSVRAVRKAVPAPDGCLDNDTTNVEAFDVTITYSGPLDDVQFAIDSPTESWCIDASGSAGQLFPSGVTRQIIVRFADGYMSADAPLVVWVQPVNGPHTLVFAFH